MTVLQNVARANNRSMLIVFGAISAVITIAAVSLFGGLPVTFISADAFRLLIILAGFFLSLLLAVRGARGAHDVHRITLRSGYVLWAFLLSTETFFSRPNQGEDNPLSGKFTLNAYGEAISWLFVGLVLLTLTLKHSDYLRNLFRGNYKYVSLFTLACVASVAFAQEPLFSLAWSLKLILVTMVVCLCFSETQTVPELRTFLWLTFWVFVFLTAEPVIQGLLRGSAFSGTEFGGELNIEPGRFHSTAHPLIIGGRAGIVALLSFMFYFLEKRKWLLIIPLVCAVVIAITGAKTAFISAAISVVLFFALRRRFGAALMAVVGMLIIALIVIETTSVGGYLKDYLSSAQEGSTLTGRTDLWAAAFPLILQRPILGHGYVSSKFITSLTNIPWFAGHMHNGMMEALYNTGVIGLGLILAIHVLTFINLRKVAKQTRSKPIAILSIGLLTIYVNIFLNSMSEPWYGGQMNAFFALFLALFAISEWLRRFVSQPHQRELAPLNLVTQRPAVAPTFLNR